MTTQLSSDSPQNRQNQLQLEWDAHRASNSPLAKLEQYQRQMGVNSAVQAGAAARTAMETADIARSQREISRSMGDIAVGMNQLAGLAHRNAETLDGIRDDLGEISKGIKSAAELQHAVIMREAFQGEIEESIFQFGESLDRMDEAAKSREDHVTVYFSSLAMSEDLEASGLDTRLIRGVGNKERFANNRKRLASLLSKLERKENVRKALEWIRKQEQLQQQAESLRLQKAGEWNEITSTLRRRSLKALPLRLVLLFVNLFVVLAFFAVIIPLLNLPDLPDILAVLLIMTLLIGCGLVSWRCSVLLSNRIVNRMIHKVDDDSAPIPKRSTIALKRRLRDLNEQSGS